MLSRDFTKGVVYDVTQRCKQDAKEKLIPFIQLIVDQPVHALILEVKNENQRDFENILPVLGGFHTQVLFMATIYRRFKGSRLEDLTIAAGIMEARSKDQPLQGSTPQTPQKRYASTQVDVRILGKASYIVKY